MIFTQTLCIFFVCVCWSPKKQKWNSFRKLFSKFLQIFPSTKQKIYQGILLNYVSFGEHSRKRLNVERGVMNIYACRVNFGEWFVRTTSQFLHFTMHSTPKDKKLCKTYIVSGTQTNMKRHSISLNVTRALCFSFVCVRVEKSAKIIQNIWMIVILCTHELCFCTLYKLNT